MKPRNHWDIASCAVKQNIRRFGTHPIPINLAGFVKVSVAAQVGKRSNIIKFENIPHHRRKEICHTSLLFEVRSNKDEPNSTHITVAGNRVNNPVDVATPTGSLELLKLIINTNLYCPGKRFACFDIKNFYLDNPMDLSEYTRIKLSVISQEIIDEYNILDYEHYRWIYFEIVRGCYGLPKSRRLTNDLLYKRLNKEDYCESSTTPGLWRHKWRLIQFMLIVDNFGVEYVGRKHAEHLTSVLKKYHDISEDWEEKKLQALT